VLASIFDKEISAEVLAEEGRGNLLSFYEDRPNNWDAWDIDIFYENQLLAHPKLVKRRWIAGGPVRQGILQEFKIGSSKISQKVYLGADSKRLDFETSVNWQESHKMLRVSFEVNIYSDRASYEIQYGQVQRNTHRNTSYDMAKFEAAGHRFADLSDKDYGAALLNDCKYGYKIYNNIIDLNLLRSPILPDPQADRGNHQFTYSFLPHTGDLASSSVLSEAAQLNQPPAVFPGVDGSDTKFPVSLDSEGAVLEVIKKAEKDGSMIVRLYEPHGRRAKIKLQFSAVTAEVF